MDIEFRKSNEWVIVDVGNRVDSFNGDSVREKFAEEIEKGKNHIALNLRDTHFISLPIIKYISSMAEKINKDGRQFALVATPEKLKRQIDIYASLKDMIIFRSEKDWQSHSQNIKWGTP